MGSAKNGVVNIGEEDYCSSREVSEDLRGDEIYTWGFSGKETTDYISDISRGDGSRWEGGGEEIMYMCGVVWIENIGMGLERGVEV